MESPRPSDSGVCSPRFREVDHLSGGPESAHRALKPEPPRGGTRLSSVELLSGATKSDSTAGEVLPSRARGGLDTHQGAGRPSRNGSGCSIERSPPLPECGFTGVKRSWSRGASGFRGIGGVTGTPEAYPTASGRSLAWEGSARAGSIDWLDRSAGIVALSARSREEGLDGALGQDSEQPTVGPNDLDALGVHDPLEL